MARKPKQKQKPQPEAAKSFEDIAPFESDSGEDDTAVEPDLPAPDAHSKSRDWRDVARYKEMRLLRKLVDDDLDLDLDAPRPRR